MARITENFDFGTISVWEADKGFTFNKDALKRAYNYITVYSTVVHILDTINWEVEIGLNNDGTLEFFNEYAYFSIPIKEVEKILMDS